jgi:hypothetical protein
MDDDAVVSRGKRSWEVLREPTVERELKDLLERLLKRASEVLREPT